MRKPRGERERFLRREGRTPPQSEMIIPFLLIKCLKHFFIHKMKNTNYSKARAQEQVKHRERRGRRV